MIVFCMSNPFDFLDQRLSIIESLILQSLEKESTANLVRDDDVLDVEGVAKLLHKSVDTIYSYTHKRVIPHSKPLGNLLFSKKELLEWIKTYKVKTMDESEMDADFHIIQKNKKKRA